MSMQAAVTIHGGAECEEGVRALAQVLPGIRALRDVTLNELERHRGCLTPVIYKRVRHVVTENDRVKKAASALKTGDMAEVRSAHG